MPAGVTLFDTHCHLNDGDAFPDPAATWAEAQAAGVAYGCVVGVEAADSRAAIALAERLPGLYAAVGWHPNQAQTLDEAGWAEIEAVARHPRVVAIGETGLDAHWNYSTRSQQVAAYERHVSLAEQLGKPLVIHCREAVPDLLAMMEARPPRVGFVFHCFSGNSDEARRVLELGGYLGFDGPLTYRRNDELRAMVAGLPRDRVLLETDAPWLTPHPYRKERNRPALVAVVNETLAEIWGVAPEESARITTENGLRFFGLD
jgi:TatD DNase family protein